MKTTIAAYALCLAGGAFLGRMELHTDDTGVEVFLLLAITAALGLLHPRRAWQWGLLVGPWIPGADLLFGRAQGLRSLGLLLAVVVALGAGASYAGALVRRAAVRMP